MLVIFLMNYAYNAFAGGYGTWTVPTRIDVERGNGFMVYGNFGNPNNCTNSSRFYVPVTHPQYDKMYSLVLTAFTSNKQISPYFHKCSAVTWYSLPSVTYNWVSSGSIGIRNN